MKRLTTALVLATVALTGVTLAGCTTTSGSAPTSDVQVTSDTVIVDVRTPAEYASGHLDGAVNIDWEGADFMTTLDGLDKNGAYVLYCHSGRRAGEALAMMQSMGFTNVTNLGGIDQAAATTGIAVVTS